MNARLYDPAIGRFLSPDPYVQMPENSQNFNRYSYCLNNPLKYTDESGEWFWFVVGVAAVLGGTGNLIANWDKIKNSNDGWSAFGKGFSYFLIGATASAVGTAVGIAVAAGGFAGITTMTAIDYTAATTGIWAGAKSMSAAGAATGFLNDFFSSLYEGENIGNAIEKGTNSAFKGGCYGAIAGGMWGVYQAWEQGANIFTGNGNYSVYQGLDINRDVRYVGMTGRDPNIRFQEHLRSATERANLEFAVKHEGLTKNQARILEQQYINQYGMMKNGGQLYNMRNEIAPKWWMKYSIMPFNY